MNPAAHVPDPVDGLPVGPSVREDLREARADLKKLYGDRLSRLVLFGSQARGEAHPESDVDVLVVLKGPIVVLEEIRRTNRITVQVLLQRGEFLTLQPFSESDLESTSHLLMRHVEEEGVEL